MKIEMKRVAARLQIGTGMSCYIVKRSNGESLDSIHSLSYHPKSVHKVRQCDCILNIKLLKYSSFVCISCGIVDIKDCADLGKTLPVIYQDGHLQLAGREFIERVLGLEDHFYL